MLSTMESSDLPADLTVLRDAERARDELAASIALPRAHDGIIGTCVALNVMSFAIATVVDEPWAFGCLVVQLVLWWLVALVEMWRFSRLNGVRVSGYAHKVVLGNTPMAAVGFFAALGAAHLAGAQGLWWLVGVTAVAGALVWVHGGRRWLRAYRADAGRLGAPKETGPWMLALATVLAVAMGVLVVLAGTRG